MSSDGTRPRKEDEWTKQIAARRGDTRDVKARKVHHLTWTDTHGAHEATVVERTIAGSAQGAGLLIDDKTVSRLHAELEPRGNDLWVRDLGSKNGTYVNGVQVDGARVPDGGELRLGETTLTVGRDAIPNLVALWPEDRFGPLIGGSPAMRELYAILARVSPMDSSVLIQGETGTGKELVARAIHDASPRAQQPFVIIDCAALPEALLEGELFGHARGAFTGAITARAGAIEAAHEGTVFLDEIGELPLAVQPKLLRVLESRTVRRLGETQYRSVDVRFVAATHRDLTKMVNAGAFREDLYFRLAVVPVRVPALRERPSDLPALVRHFLGSQAKAFGPDLMALLCARPWIGNVRELRNFVERAIVLGPREALAMSAPDARAPIGSGHFTGNAGDPPEEAKSDPPVRDDAGAPAIVPDLPFKDLREQWLDHFEREYVRALLAKHQRNVPAAAQAAGLDRTYIYKLIRKHNV